MAKSYTTDELKARYGASEQANFEVIDTIGVPHPFTIGPRHVVHASDNHGGMLGEATCRAIKCAHPRCTLSYEEHESALLISCKADLQIAGSKETNPELQVYLMQSKPLCEEDGYAGFAFAKHREEH